MSSGLGVSLPETLVNGKKQHGLVLIVDIFQEDTRVWCQWVACWVDMQAAGFACNMCGCVMAPNYFGGLHDRACQRCKVGREQGEFLQHTHANATNKILRT